MLINYIFLWIKRYCTRGGLVLLSSPPLGFFFLQPSGPNPLLKQPTTRSSCFGTFYVYVWPQIIPLGIFFQITNFQWTDLIIKQLGFYVYTAYGWQIAAQSYTLMCFFFLFCSKYDCALVSWVPLAGHIVSVLVPYASYLSWKLPQKKTQKNKLQSWCAYVEVSRHFYGNWQSFLKTYLSII